LNLLGKHFTSLNVASASDTEIDLSVITLMNSLKWPGLW
jgi:hypothetical protein